MDFLCREEKNAYLIVSIFYEANEKKTGCCTTFHIRELVSRDDFFVHVHSSIEASLTKVKKKERRVCIPAFKNHGNSRELSEKRDTAGFCILR